MCITSLVSTKEIVLCHCLIVWLTGLDKNKQLYRKADLDQMWILNFWEEQQARKAFNDKLQDYKTKKMDEAPPSSNAFLKIFVAKICSIFTEKIRKMQLYVLKIKNQKTLSYYTTLYFHIYYEGPLPFIVFSSFLYPDCFFFFFWCFFVDCIHTTSPSPVCVLPSQLLCPSS